MIDSIVRTVGSANRLEKCMSIRDELHGGDPGLRLAMSFFSEPVLAALARAIPERGVSLFERFCEWQEDGREGEGLTDWMGEMIALTPVYDDLTTEQVRSAVRKAKMGCHDDDELKRRIRAATGYTGSISVTSTSTGSPPMIMTMFMIMMSSPDGEVLSL
jgi:hypothetical protein